MYIKRTVHIIMSKKNTKGGAAHARHRRVIRDSIQGITKPAIRRLARKAGIKRIGGNVYEEVRGIIKVEIENILKDTIILIDNKHKKTISGDDVRLAIRVSKNKNLTFNESRKRKNDLTLNIYIARILKQVHPNAGITADALNQCDQITKILLNRIVEIAKAATFNKNKKTLGDKEIQAVVKLVFPGELARHAVSEGTKAITKFSSSETGDSKSKRSGLVLSPSRVETLIRGKGKKFELNLGSLASIYLAAVLEYFIAEVLELAGNTARDNNRVRIKSRDIHLSALYDDELNRLFDNLGIIMSNAGVMPNINSALLPNKKSKKESVEESRSY